MVWIQMTMPGDAPDATPLMIEAIVKFTELDELESVDPPFVPHFHCSENWTDVLGAT